MKEITAEELKQKKDSNESFILLDVRDTHEYYMSDLDGTTRIPLDNLMDRMDELEKETEIVIMCRSGNRSAKAVQLLTENGFTDVSNLKGGINDWARKVDPSMPEY